MSSSVRALVVLAGLLAMLFAAPAPARADDHGDDAAHATALQAGATKSGRIFPGRDQDWFKVTAAAGEVWTFRTTSPWPMDTTLRLIDRDGRAQIVYDDDGGGGRASRIVWRAPLDGTYHVWVGHYDWRWGVGSYTLTASVVPGATPPPTGGATISLDAARVYDPKLDDGAGGRPTLAIDLRVDPAGSYLVDLDLHDATGARLARLLTSDPQAGGVARRIAWDGTTPVGAGGASVVVDPGVYRLRLAARAAGTPSNAAPLSVHEREVRVARLGASAVALVPSAAGGGVKAHYLYHKAGGSARYRTVLAQDPDWKLGGIGSGDPGDLDMRDGRPRPSPLLWTDTAVPPGGESFSRPAVIARGGALEAWVTLGQRPVSQARPGTVVGAGYPIAGLPLRVLVNGVAASGQASPGNRYFAATAISAPGGLSRGEAALRISFEFEEGGAWRAVPGEQRARIRFYSILDVPDLAPAGFASGAAPYLPWLAAVDLVCGVVAPGVSDEALVTHAVADHVFERMGLSYDTTNGSPAYAFGNLDELELQLADLFDRANGSRVNCSDCGTLTATLANMVGCDVDYTIFGYNFPLNYMRLLGSGVFSNDPFHQGFQGAFAFHATASSDGGITVEDACVAIDGDGAPGSLPCTELRPRGMRFDAYRAAVTPDFPAITVVRRPKLR